MTKEEAIRIVQECRQYLMSGSPIWDIQIIDEALGMAIEALSESDDVNHDGCDGCRYEQNTEYEYPCSECKQRYMDMWEQKPNDFVAVVRCGECKHMLADGRCKEFADDGIRPSVSDFCSYGERKK